MPLVFIVIQVRLGVVVERVFVALALDFWIEMARSYGRDGGVIFELWNEPVVDPKLWVSTGEHWPMLKSVWLQLIAVIRRHSDAIVLVSGGRWAHDLKGVARDPRSRT